MNNKKSLIALILIALVAVVGLTIAYFTDSVTFENQFKTKPYSTSVTEEFVSPNNWTPGTETSKTVYATNDGDVDVAVRVSYTEKWLSKNGDTLSNTYNGSNAAIINLDNETEWTYNNGYYYYNNKLTKGNSTSSFMKSVTFNPLVQADSNCTNEEDIIDSTTNEKIGVKTTCSSTGDGYDGATYTLTIKVETVQYDSYKDAWSTNVVIN